MLTITVILALAALIIAIISAVRPWPLWVAVVLLAIAVALQALPIGK